MSGWLIGAVGLVYLYCAADQYGLGNTGAWIMFAGYAVANVGIIMQLR